MIRTTLAATLLLLVPRGGPAELPAWRDVELAPQTYLDLERGLLVSRPEEIAGAYLTLEEGRLVGSPPLRALMRPGPLLPSWTMRRFEGLASPGVDAVPGSECVFDAGGDRWGYVRVLAVDDGVARLELAYAAAGSMELVRDPVEIAAESTPDGIVLAWRPARRADADAGTGAGASRGADAGARDFASASDAREYLVWRSVVGSTDAPELVARVRGESWTDASPPSRLLEYRVARASTVAVAGGGEAATRDGDAATGDGGAVAPSALPASLGARTRAVPVERPGEWPLDLEAGMTLDLLTGETGGDDAHIEILRPGPSSVQVRPREGVTLSRLVPRDETSWLVPDEYQPGLAHVPLGGEIVARLPEGVYVRLSFLGQEHETARLVRQLDPWGGRVLPRAPELPEARWTPDGVELRFPPASSDGPEREFAVLVVERERQYGGDDWFEAEVVSADRLEVKVEESARGELTRYRYRHRLANGLASVPSPAQRIMLGDPADPATADALLERAFRDLADPDWRKRGEARDLIELLGDRAFDRLVASLRSSDPSIASAARALLLETSEGKGGAHVRAILEARAALEGVDAAAPDGFLAPLAHERAWAVLAPRGASGAERAAWLRVLALADPDPAVRALAELAWMRPARSERDLGGVPWALLPPSARARADAPELGRVMAEGGDGHELGRALELAAQLDHPRAALVTLEVAARVERESIPWVGWSERLSDPELALELVDRYLEGGEPVLLGAAEALVATPRVRLSAFERLGRARLDHVPSASLGKDLGRERVEIAAPDYELLSDLLATYKGGRERPVDLVLPDGDYRPMPGRAAGTLDIQGAGLRLLGRPGGVRIHATVRVHQARDVVLEGLSIEGDASAALSVIDSSVTVRDCDLAGPDCTIVAQRSTVELDRVHLKPHTGERGSAFSIRTSGESFVLARGSLLMSGGIFAAAEDGLVYLERCFVDGRERTALQVQKGCAAVVRDSVLRARTSLLFGTTLLEGVVLDCEGSPVQPGDGEIRYCPDHLFYAGARADLVGAEAFEGCPLEAR